MARIALVLVTMMLLAGCASNRPGKHSTTDSPELEKVVEAFFDEYLAHNPTYATAISDHRFDDRLDDSISPKSVAAMKELHTRYLQKVRAIDKSRLSEADQLTYELFEGRMERELAALNIPTHLLPVNQLFSLPMRLPLLGSGSGTQPFKTVENYDNFLKRAGQFPGWVDQAIANMREGIKTGIVQPKPVTERTITSLQRLIVTRPEESIFYGPVTNFPASFSPQDQQRLKEQYTQLITRELMPAYTKLTQFLRDEYLPKCRDTVGFSALPNGREWYAQLAEHQTTTTLTPDEIFTIGQSEYNRLRARMEAVKQKEGFTGDLRAFVKHLESRPGVGAKTKPELLKAYNDLRAKVEPQLPRLFKSLPKAPYEIRTVEEYRENSAPSQYWSPAPDGSRPGIFYVNAAAIANGPMSVSESLYLHEAMPGHHFQIAIAMEQPKRPRFRRFAGYTGYAEGWGLYSELLGYELGCFTDPLQEMTYLGADMFRAQRLVVDVGIHHKGWTRQQAIEFLQQNPGRFESAEREVDRYIANPGQALAYKIGQLKMSELRARAEKALGSRFDIREYHDLVLNASSLPLDVLERRVDRWIKAQQPL